MDPGPFPEKRGNVIERPPGEDPSSANLQKSVSFQPLLCNKSGMGKKPRQARFEPRRAVSSGPGPSPKSVPDAPAPAARGSLTGWRRNLARAAVAVLGPLVVLTLLELGLRLVGYGHATSLFVRMEDGETLTTNRRFLWRFMKRETGVPPYPVTMPATKPSGTIRIFVLGESAAQGTPAPAFGFGRILEVMLQRQFPERRFEVVNVAQRGVNSHVILPIARECARYAPDLEREGSNYNICRVMSRGDRCEDIFREEVDRKGS